MGLVNSPKCTKIVLKFVYFHILFIAKFGFISSYGWSSLWLRHKIDPKKTSGQYYNLSYNVKTRGVSFTLKTKYLKAKGLRIMETQVFQCTNI
jgi:hypothetical protein